MTLGRMPVLKWDRPRGRFNVIFLFCYVSTKFPIWSCSSGFPNRECRAALTSKPLGLLRTPTGKQRQPSASRTIALCLKRPPLPLKSLHPQPWERPPVTRFFRKDGRATNQLRPLTLEPHFVRTAEGSVLISVEHTRVLCNATIENGVPGWMRNSGRGWVTAEYAMLPRATLTRSATGE